MKKLWICLLFMFSLPLWADYAPGIEWKIINTEHFNIIFDARLEDDAREVAALIEELYEPLTEDLEGKIDRYEIILSAESVVSNGYVTNVGQKSVFFPVPPQEGFTGSLDWYDMLSVHEGRHMAQQSYIRTAPLKKLSEFFYGDMGYNFLVPYLAFTIHTLPGYYYEGDAVLTETLLTKGGRGRLPDFERGLRTLLLSGEDITFSQAVVGSQREYVPNIYVYGYYFVTWLKREYGPDVITRIADFASNYPFVLNFSVACFSVTGDTMPTIYDKVMEDLTTLWKEQDILISPTKSESIEVPDKVVYTNYRNSEVLPDGRLLYIKGGLEDLSTLTLLEKDGSEKSLFKVLDSIDVHEYNVVYTLKSRHSRWQSRGYSDIRTYDVLTGEHRALTSEGRYFAPAYSPDGSKIAAVEADHNRNFSLVVLDANTGEIVQKHSAADLFIAEPQWLEDGINIFAFFTGRSGALPGIIHSETGKLTQLLGADYIDRVHPFVSGNYVFYRSGYSGVNDIFALDLTEKKEYRVISSRFGADYPLVNGKELIFSDYDVMGYSLKKTALDPSLWEPVEAVERSHVDYFLPVAEAAENEPLEYGKIPPFSGEAQDYSPLANSLDIHSWFLNPLVPLLSTYGTFDTKSDLPFTVMEGVLFSDDKLENLSLIMFSHYNLTNHRYDAGVQALIKGFWPVVEMTAIAGGDMDDQELTGSALQADAYLPFNFSSGVTLREFRLGFSPLWEYSFLSSETLFFSGAAYIQHKWAEAGHVRRVDGWDHYSRQKIGFYHDFLTGNNSRLQWDGLNILPGILANDRLRVIHTHLWDLTDTNQVAEIDIFNMAVNSSYQNYDNYFSSLFRLDYTLPLFYPEAALFDWIYFKDVRLSLSGEILTDWKANFSDAWGGGLSIDYNIFRIPFFNFRTTIQIMYSREIDNIALGIIPVEVVVPLE